MREPARPSSISPLAAPLRLHAGEIVGESRIAEFEILMEGEPTRHRRDDETASIVPAPHRLHRQGAHGLSLLHRDDGVRRAHRLEMVAGRKITTRTQGHVARLDHLHWTIIGHDRLRFARGPGEDGLGCLRILIRDFEKAPFPLRSVAPVGFAGVAGDE